MRKGFENGVLVPVGTFKINSSWPSMPNEDRQRAERVAPVLVYGQSEAMQNTYEKAIEKQQTDKRVAGMRDLMNRMANLDR